MSELPYYEKLGVFYLGKEYDLGRRELGSEAVLYDSKDLTTHALCVGMTGSGKTGLCLALLEEAAIDGIPAICLDPKGDLGNLLLTFPDLAPSDFQEWIDPSDATRQGLTNEELAEKTAQRWRSGLESWDQKPDRIQRFRDSVDISIYTPGSNAGLPLTVLKSFDAPPECIRDDAESMRDRVTGAASGLLTLLNRQADPLTSPEHILISKILDDIWKQGKNLTLADLIRYIQTPPFKQVGVLDVDSFFPADKRAQLAMQLNNLLASPAFAGWLEGESLDIKKLLYTAEGKPRLSIISIAHLNDSERMFFVTLLLGELLSWTRSQPGTSSLRAIFYMDEVFGYFPPVANPPSKPPMMTLLKQARAFGVGIVLATQNPVDLDYKGLANIGTWMLGRLQTQRDKERVLEGLEGAAAQTGSTFNRQAMEQTLAGLGSRVFLLNCVHNDQPIIFQSRWVLSYLRGPLSRPQIQKLMAAKKSSSHTAASSAREVEADNLNRANIQSNNKDTTSTDLKRTTPSPESKSRPILPAGIIERFIVPSRVPRTGGRYVYQSALLADTSLHFVLAKSKTDVWQDRNLMVMCSSSVPDPLWPAGREFPAGHFDLHDAPEEGFEFLELPIEMVSSKNFTAWEKSLKDHLYRQFQLRIYYSPAIKEYSSSNTEMDARIEFSQRIREARDLEIEKLRSKFASRLQTMQSRISAAEQRLAKEQQEFKNESLSTVVEVGTSIFGALFGKKLASRTNMSKINSSTKSFGRATRQKEDVARAEATLGELLEARAVLEQELATAIDAITEQFCAEGGEIEAIDIPNRKSDIRIKQLVIAWIPWEYDANGIRTPLVELPEPQK